MKQIEKTTLVSALPSGSSCRAQDLDRRGAGEGAGARSPQPRRPAPGPAPAPARTGGHPGQHPEQHGFERVQDRAAPAEARAVHPSDDQRRHKRGNDLGAEEECGRRQRAAGALVDEDGQGQGANRPGQLVEPVGQEQPAIDAGGENSFHRRCRRRPGMAMQRCVPIEHICAAQLSQGAIRSKPHTRVRQGSEPTFPPRPAHRLDRAPPPPGCHPLYDVRSRPVLAPQPHLRPRRFPAGAAGRRRADQRSRSACPRATRRATIGAILESPARCATAASSTRSSSSTTRATTPPRSPASSASRSTIRSSCCPSSARCSARATRCGARCPSSAARWSASSTPTPRSSARISPAGCSGRCCADREISFVKGFYRRPVRVGETDPARRRRPGHRADGPAAAEPVLSRAGGRRASRWPARSPPGASCSSGCRSSPATASTSRCCSTPTADVGLDAHRPGRPRRAPERPPAAARPGADGLRGAARGGLAAASARAGSAARCRPAFLSPGEPERGSRPQPVERPPLAELRAAA